MSQVGWLGHLELFYIHQMNDGF